MGNPLAGKGLETKRFAFAIPPRTRLYPFCFMCVYFEATGTSEFVTRSFNNLKTDRLPKQWCRLHAYCYLNFCLANSDALINSWVLFSRSGQEIKSKYGDLTECILVAHLFRDRRSQIHVHHVRQLNA